MSATNNNTNFETTLTEGSIWKRMVAFAIPLFFGNLFQQLYNAADSLIVGNFLGKQALAAVSSTSSLIFLLVGWNCHRCRCCHCSLLWCKRHEISSSSRTYYRYVWYYLRSGPDGYRTCDSSISPKTDAHPGRCPSKFYFVFQNLFSGFTGVCAV